MSFLSFISSHKDRFFSSSSPSSHPFIEHSFGIWSQKQRNLPQKEAKRLLHTILECARTQCDTLKICYFPHLTELPPCLFELPHLKKLYLHSNSIQKLPPAIAQLSQLEELFLSSNQMKELPAEIGHLKHLQVLSVNSNQLQTLPQEIGKLHNLKTLELNHNHIDWLPETLGELVSLSRLQLNNNFLSELPHSLSQLHQLQFFTACFNRFSEVPSCLFSLPQLKKISLANNSIKTISPEIAQLPLLRELNISCNHHLGSLPLSLTSLSSLARVSCYDTQVPGGQLQDLLEIIQRRRENRKNSPLPELLTHWCQQGKTEGAPPPSLDFILKLPESQQKSIHILLSRLSLCSDFRNQQQELATLVCHLLGALQKDPDFCRDFFHQVDSNNSHCRDRTAMAFNELYTCWMLHQMKRNPCPTQEKLNLLCKLAKTFTLRKILGKLIHSFLPDQQESVEIYLYYEALLKERLSLFTLFDLDKMAYRQIGKRDWIDAEALVQDVNDFYIEELLSLPLLENLMKNDPEYLKDFNALHSSACQQLNAVPSSSNSLEHIHFNKEIQNQLEKSTQLLKQLWIKKHLHTEK